MSAEKIARSKSGAWADLPSSEIEALISDSRAQGSREALCGVEKRAPFFAKRMRDLSIANWHLLLGLSSLGIALDVGAGFGSNVLGLASFYQTAIGIDFLPDRLRYASLRAAQTQRHNCQVARADGHSLPFASGSFSLVTMNGVLEWAALYDDERTPRDSQIVMLKEARRLLAPGGNVCVAIENRFALESLLAALGCLLGRLRRAGRGQKGKTDHRTLLHRKAPPGRALGPRPGRRRLRPPGPVRCDAALCS